MKTRLLTFDRSSICKAIVEHKFGPIEAVLDAEEAVLAEEARVRATGDYLKTMERAPNGAFPTKDDFNVTVDGQYHSLRFGGKYPNAISRRVLYSATQYSGRLGLLHTDDLGARILDLVSRQRSSLKERDGLKSQVDATLESFRTFDALLEAWPEAEKFITERWRTRGGAPTNLPAVVLSKLSAALDLPPEDADEPASAAA